MSNRGKGSVPTAPAEVKKKKLVASPAQPVTGVDGIPQSYLDRFLWQTQYEAEALYAPAIYAIVMKTAHLDLSTTWSLIPECIQDKCFAVDYPEVIFSFAQQHYDFSPKPAPRTEAQPGQQRPPLPKQAVQKAYGYLHCVLERFYPDKLRQDCAKVLRTSMSLKADRVKLDGLLRMHTEKKQANPVDPPSDASDVVSLYELEGGPGQPSMTWVTTCGAHGELFYFTRKPPTAEQKKEGNWFQVKGTVNNTAALVHYIWHCIHVSWLRVIRLCAFAEDSARKGLKIPESELGLKQLAASTHLIFHQQELYQIQCAHARRLNALGNALYHENRVIEACAIYVRALMVCPPGASRVRQMVLANRAACHLHLGNFHLARMDAAAVVELNPPYIKAFFRRGVAAALVGDAPHALCDMYATMECSPVDAPEYTEFIAWLVNHSPRDGSCSVARTVAESTIRRKVEKPRSLGNLRYGAPDEVLDYFRRSREERVVPARSFEKALETPAQREVARFLAEHAELMLQSSSQPRRVTGGRSPYSQTQSSQIEFYAALRQAMRARDTSGAIEEREQALEELVREDEEANRKKGPATSGGGKRPTAAKASQPPKTFKVPELRSARSETTEDDNFPQTLMAFADRRCPPEPNPFRFFGRQNIKAMIAHVFGSEVNDNDLMLDEEEIEMPLQPQRPTKAGSVDLDEQD